MSTLSVRITPRRLVAATPTGSFSGALRTFSNLWLGMPRPPAVRSLLPGTSSHGSALSPQAQSRSFRAEPRPVQGCLQLGARWHRKRDPLRLPPQFPPRGPTPRPPSAPHQDGPVLLGDPALLLAAKQVAHGGPAPAGRARRRRPAATVLRSPYGGRVEPRAAEREAASYLRVRARWLDFPGVANALPRPFGQWNGIFD